MATRLGLAVWAILPGLYQGGKAPQCVLPLARVSYETYGSYGSCGTNGDNTLTRDRAFLSRPAGQQRRGVRQVGEQHIRRVVGQFLPAVPSRANGRGAGADGAGAAHFVRRIADHRDTIGI